MTEGACIAILNDGRRIIDGGKSGPILVDPNGGFQAHIQEMSGPYKAALMKLMAQYESKHSLPPPHVNHAIREGLWEMTDPRYYDSQTIRRIVSEANALIDTTHYPDGMQLSRIAAVTRAVNRIIPYDLQYDPDGPTRGIVGADQFTELSPMIRQVGRAVCRHQAPATVAAIAQIGKPTDDFQDVVLVYHGLTNSPNTHALAFVPSRGMFADGSTGEVFTTSEYLSLGKGNVKPDLTTFKYGYYPPQPKGKEVVMQFRHFDPLNPLSISHQNFVPKRVY